MKRLMTILLTTTLTTLTMSAMAQPSTTMQSRIVPTQVEQLRDERLAQDWGLNADEWLRYRELMEGPLGTYSPNLDPLSALGIEARSDDERQRYAELQVQAEARRVEKLLAYQRAYDEAWQRQNPDLLRVNLPDAGLNRNTVTGNGRTAVFVKENCQPCTQLVQRLQASSTPFDLYMVGSHQDDVRIRNWARHAQIDPELVRNSTITLNHDAGRWLSLGLSGDLPASIRQVNGQWQRQP